jgi:prevent-host-death family protein
VVEQMAYFDVQQAKKYLSNLIERASNGEEIVITMAGKPVARLLPILEEHVALRVPGNDKGKIIIKPDFDDPSHEFDE